jgi:DNA-directed RNA polymerase subunit RPC12/RpoP
MGGDRLVKCGLCGGEVKEQPKITADGKCSVCGAKLAVEK